MSQCINAVQLYRNVDLQIGRLKGHRNLLTTSSPIFRLTAPLLSFRVVATSTTMTPLIASLFHQVKSTAALNPPPELRTLYSRTAALPPTKPRSSPLLQRSTPMMTNVTIRMMSKMLGEQSTPQCLVATRSMLTSGTGMKKRCSGPSR